MNTPFCPFQLCSAGMTLGILFPAKDEMPNMHVMIRVSVFFIMMIFLLNLGLMRYSLVCERCESEIEYVFIVFILTS